MLFTLSYTKLWFKIFNLKLCTVHLLIYITSVSYTDLSITICANFCSTFVWQLWQIASLIFFLSFIMSWCWIAFYLFNLLVIELLRFSETVLCWALSFALNWSKWSTLFVTLALITLGPFFFMMHLQLVANNLLTCSCMK